jgi:hypothetical protein
LNNQLYKTKFFTYLCAIDILRLTAMTDSTQSLRDDIAFMRALADEGVRPPLLAGPSMMIAGGLWGVACIAIWIGIKFLGYSNNWQTVTQVAPMGIFALIMPFNIRRVRRKPGYRSPANQAVGMAWAGAGSGIFVLAACTFMVCWRMRSGLPAQMMPSEVLVLYGVAWTVAAAMTRDRFLWVVAVASFASSILVAAFISSIDEYLVFSIVLILVAFIPGYVLWRREPKDIV